MNVTGVIAEYNPFHNGHLHQYEEIRRKSADGCQLIVVMSGSFVQRGEPAIYDKYTRTRAALNAGADLVLEIPAIFATSSAKDFAAAAVTLLDRLGVVDELCFGSECGDIRQLAELADVLAEEPEDYRRLLRANLSDGKSFPQARNQALLSWSEQSFANDEKKALWSSLLSAPNNILGLEYMVALKKRGSHIKPITIPRSGQGYHDTGMEQGFASASGIRACLSAAGQHIIPPAGQQEIPAAVQHQVPPDAAALYQQAVPVFPADCSLLLNEKLLSLQYHGVPYHSFADVSEELSGRLDKLVLNYASFPERIMQLKTKQYTYTRISRALIHILLDMKKDELAAYQEHDYVTYARLLGFRKESAPLLSRLKHAADLPLVTKTADARETLTGLSLQMFQQDLYCTHLYQTIRHQKSGEIPRNEFTQPIVIV